MTGQGIVLEHEIIELTMEFSDADRLEEMHRKLTHKLYLMYFESTSAVASQTCVLDHRYELVNLIIPTF